MWGFWLSTLMVWLYNGHHKALQRRYNRALRAMSSLSITCIDWPWPRRAHGPTWQRLDTENICDTRINSARWSCLTFSSSRSNSSFLDSEPLTFSSSRSNSSFLDSEPCFSVYTHRETDTTPWYNALIQSDIQHNQRLIPALFNLFFGSEPFAAVLSAHGTHGGYSWGPKGRSSKPKTDSREGVLGEGQWKRQRSWTNIVSSPGGVQRAPNANTFWMH